MENVLVLYCCYNKTNSFVASNNIHLFPYSSRAQKSKISLSVGLCSFWRLLWKMYFSTFSIFHRLPAFFGSWSPSPPSCLIFHSHISSHCSLLPDLLLLSYKDPVLALALHGYSWIISPSPGLYFNHLSKVHFTM